MKEEVHPPYYPDATVTCACGNTFTVGSTKQAMHVEVCAACHPFYTGQKKLVDTRGRVERFERIARKSKEVQTVRAKQKAAPRKKKDVEILTEKQWKKLG